MDIAEINILLRTITTLVKYVVGTKENELIYNFSCIQYNAHKEKLALSHKVHLSINIFSLNRIHITGQRAKL